ncbi:cupin domain-containing protein [Streptacidiphilus sp. PAMC 29251]
MGRIARLAAVGVTAIALTSLNLGAAEATPAGGVTARILWQHTAGGRDFVLREITIAPGGSTGWHFHDGTLFGVVQQGTLTHNAHDCSVDGVYHAGQPIQEPSGADHVHLGRNLGATPVVLDVLYVDPADSPLSEDAPNPGCDFQ